MSTNNFLIELPERVDDDKYLDRKLEHECDSLNERIGIIEYYIR